MGLVLVAAVTLWRVSGGVIAAHAVRGTPFDVAGALQSILFESLHAWAGGAWAFYLRSRVECLAILESAD
jgi:hypothetical protein